MWQDPMPGLASDPLLLHDTGDGISIVGTKLESTKGGHKRWEHRLRSVARTRRRNESARDDERH